jgi:hypothetical protein
MFMLMFTFMFRFSFKFILHMKYPLCTCTNIYKNISPRYAREDDDRFASGPGIEPVYCPDS